MNHKGQLAIIDVAISAIIGLIVLSLLIGAFWPIADNFLDLTNTAPNYSLFRPIADFIPAIIFLIFIVLIVRAASGQNQQQRL